MKKKILKLCLIGIGVILLFLLCQRYMNLYEADNSSVSYIEFLEDIQEGNVKEIKLGSGSDFSYITKDGDKFYTPNPKYDDFKKDMLEKGIEVTEPLELSMNGLTVLLYLCLFALIMRKAGFLGGGRGSEITKPVSANQTIRFDQIAGLYEVKKDLMTYVDYLKNPDSYEKAGAKMPRGVILYGPPGTGKTLLAKAIAGEAGVPFFSASGSDFVEKYVGTGAERVRKLFSAARKAAPCIIFIDELDAVGEQRDGDDNSERRQTLNALLAEIDGYLSVNKVLVIGATNRIEDLDHALIRSGRFDSHFAVPLPATTDERYEVLEMYAKDKKLEDSVDLRSLAKEMIGFSPADIQSTLNEAAILSVQKKKNCIDMDCMDAAMYKKVMKGHAKEKWDRNQEDMKRCAYHEAAHAVVGYILGEEITKISIIPSTSGAGGATFMAPSKMGLYSRRELLNQICICYAGRYGERFLKENDRDVISTGAESDIRKATEIIQKMVTRYGMAESNYDFDMLNYELFSEKKEKVLEACAKISSEQKERTAGFVNENRERIIRIAEVLLEKETIYAEEFRELMY